MISTSEKEETLSFDEIQNLIKRYTYKPDCEFEVEKFYDDQVKITIKQKVIDVNDPQRTITVISCTIFPLRQFATQEDLTELLKSAIYSFEEHEMKEWFKFDNKAVNRAH